MKRILFAIALCFITMIAFVSCSGGDGTTEYKVSLITASGVTVTSQNPVTVKSGESASFTVSMPKDYQFLTNYLVKTHEPFAEHLRPLKFLQQAQTL